MISLRDSYINFGGSGNPDADLWILGFEPGGDVLNENQKEYNTIIKNGEGQELLRHSLDYSNELVEKSQVYQQIFNLLIFFNKVSNYSYTDGRKELTFKEQSSAFYSNLFLLKWPTENPEQTDKLQIKQFEKIFAFYKEHLTDFNSKTWKRREIYTDESTDWILERGKKYFHTQLKNSNTKKIIFILKKGYEEEYLKLLSPSYKKADLKEVKTNFVHRNKRISIKYLLREHLIIFLANGLSDKIKLKNILDKLSQEDQKIKELFSQRLLNNLLDEE